MTAPILQQVANVSSSAPDLTPAGSQILAGGRVCETTGHRLADLISTPKGSQRPTTALRFCDPSGVALGANRPSFPVVSLALNHRLISSTPSGSIPKCAAQSRTIISVIRSMHAGTRHLAAGAQLAFGGG